MRSWHLAVTFISATIGAACSPRSPAPASPTPEAPRGAGARTSATTAPVAEPSADPRPRAPQYDPRTADAFARTTIPTSSAIVQAGGATGFIVADGIIATAAALVGGSLRVQVNVPGALLAADVIAEDEATGVVLAADDPVFLPAANALSRVSVATLQPGDSLRVRARGTPSAFEYRGRFRGVRLVGGSVYIDADVPVGPDAVGGPVVDKLNRVVGIAVRRRHEAAVYLVAVDHIERLLATSARPSTAPVTEPRAP